MFRRSSVLVIPFVVAAVVSGTAALAAAQTPSPAPAPAPDTAPATAPDPQAAPQTPEERIDTLDQQLKILARQLEIEKEAATAAQATAPVPLTTAATTNGMTRTDERRNMDHDSPVDARPPRWVTDRYRPDADGDHKREPDRRRQSLRTALTRTRL